MHLILISIAVIVAIYGVISWIASKPRGAVTPLANDGAVTVGIHDGARVTGFMTSLYTVGAAYPNGERFLLVKQGSGADNYYAPITSVLDVPIGTCTDDPAAITDPVNIQFLLGNDRTARMVAAGVIAAGKFVVTNGDGTVKQFDQTTAGIFWCVGVALTTTTTAGDLVEVAPGLMPLGVDVIT